MTMTCPTCRQQWAPDEEFCPQDGTPLVATAPMTEKVQAPSAAPPAVAIATSTEPPSNTASASSTSSKASFAARAAAALAEMAKRFRPTAETTAAHAACPLPPLEQDKGWRVTGQPFSTQAYDAWPVSMATPAGDVCAIFRRFRTSALTSQPCYSLLTTLTGHEGAVRLYSFGTVDAAGARLDYEITAASIGQSLQQWLYSTPPSEEKAAFLAKRLVRWLCTCHEAGFTPFAVGPDQLILDNNEEVILDTLRCVTRLTDVSIPRFVADLANNASLSLPFAAPETIERRLIADASAAFSLGQLVATALWGDPLEHAFIRARSVPFRAIKDSQLARLLMGCLWPNPEQRWSVAELVAQEAEPNSAPAVPPWESLQAGAASASFTLAGQSFWLAEDLIYAASSHWTEAIYRLDEIMLWLESTRHAAAVDLLRQEQRSGRSRDWVFSRLCRQILPDAPLVWRGYSFADADVERSLIALAQQALGDSPEAATATANLRAFFEADLRGAFLQ